MAKATATTTITKIDRTTAKDIADACQERLTAMAADMGLALRYKGGTFDPARATFMARFEFTVTANKDHRDRLLFEDQCKTFDLMPHHYRAEFTIPGRGTYRLLGFEFSRTRYPIKVEDVATGKVTLFESRVLRHLRPEPGGR